MALTDAMSIGLGAFRSAVDLWRSGKADSLIDYTAPARVEPIVLVDTDVLFMEKEMPLVMQSLQSIFAGYYLQAAQISATIGSINVIRSLGKLNPNRNASDSLITGKWIMGSEAFQNRLPSYHNGSSAAMEADDVKPMNYGSGTKDAIAQAKEEANLSVGKEIAVEITDGVHKATIMVAIRLMVASLASKSLVHILSQGSEDTSAKERFHAWRAGRLSFIRDLILCQDLVDAHRRNLMADKDGIYTAIQKRHRGNQLSTILSGDPSVATASNMVVMSSTTAAQLELDINGRLKDFKTREKIFQNTYLMIMVVIDKEYDRVIFYHRGINHSTDLGFRDLKAASKGSGPDVSEILRAYQLGAAPTL